ncbi:MULTISPECIES: hypothetical protein [unclassified Duganella]|uniref:hypothetical protein n=1 Tax=unclassified Duganella TaxID=2636909 RepID=UPI0008755637|nr:MULTISPECIES: hypothetical protein [unclassified Duganella]OEZ54300.1 hypothetical protein DUGA6_58040 [Duganella sp. HH105]OEZ98168.1 hypothetical protein DUGA2_57380 [Duganella sp. HH101]
MDIETRLIRLEEFSVEAQQRLGRLEEFAIEGRQRLERLEEFSVEAQQRLGRLEEFAIEARQRLERLEEFAIEARERMIKIETRLDHIEANMATKADLANLSATMIKWIVGMVSGAGLAAITVMTFVLNNAVPPRAAPSASPAPIVFQLPPTR